MEIRASGEFEFADMLRTCRALMVRRKWLWIALNLFGLLLIAAGVFDLTRRGTSLDGSLPLIAVGILWLSIGWWAPLISAQRMWKNNRVIPGRHEFLFHENGLHRKGQSYTYELKWDGIHTWSEDKAQFILFPGPGNAIMIPKRFFSNSADTDSLRQLLVTHIGARK